MGESGNEISTLSQPKPKTGRGNTQFAAETSALTGESKRAINLNLARAEVIGDAPTRSKGTPGASWAGVECRREHRQFFAPYR